MRYLFALIWFTSTMIADDSGLLLLMIFGLFFVSLYILMIKKDINKIKN